eukprot:1133846-Alexandrium_andersonii.AAC.1
MAWRDAAPWTAPPRCRRIAAPAPMPALPGSKRARSRLDAAGAAQARKARATASQRRVHRIAESDGPAPSSGGARLPPCR